MNLDEFGPKTSKNKFLSSAFTLSLANAFPLSFVLQIVTVGPVLDFKEPPWHRELSSSLADDDIHNISIRKFCTSLPGLTLAECKLKSPLRD